MPNRTISVDDNWSISYTSRERDSSKDIRSVQVSWENRTAEEIIANLNAFLVAIQAPLRVVRAE